MRAQQNGAVMTRMPHRFINAAVAALVFGLSTTLIAQQSPQPSARTGGQAPAAMTLAVTQYASAWAKTTEAEILEALKGCWTPNSTYTDPGTDTTRGPVELARVILGFQKAFPGATLTPTSLLDVHHNFGRFSWQLKRAAPVVVNDVTSPQESDGFDFVEFSADGTKILKIVGFFGPFPR
jgi:hypothetical protein